MRVPSCPGWNAGQLLRHLGGAHRSTELLVRAGKDAPPDQSWRDLSAYTDEDPTVLDGWLAEGAKQLADTLYAAGPDPDVWLPLAELSPLFYPRRMTHETAIHRADATLALGKRYELAPEVGLDTLDEWLELGSLPQLLDLNPEVRELLGPGRTLRLVATDHTSEDRLIDLTGEVLTWRSGGTETAAVTVRGPLTELLLLVYRRRPVDQAAVEVHGDADLLDFYLERVSFG